MLNTLENTTESSEHRLQELNRTKGGGKTWQENNKWQKENKETQKKFFF